MAAVGSEECDDLWLRTFSWNGVASRGMSVQKLKEVGYWE